MLTWSIGQMWFTIVTIVANSSGAKAIDPCIFIETTEKSIKDTEANTIDWQYYTNRKIYEQIVDLEKNVEIS